MTRARFSERLKHAKSLLEYQGFVGKYELAAIQQISPTYASMILKTLAEEMGDEVEFQGDTLWLKKVLLSAEEEPEPEPSKLKQATLDDRVLYIEK